MVSKKKGVNTSKLEKLRRVLFTKLDSISKKKFEDETVFKSPLKKPSPNCLKCNNYMSKAYEVIDKNDLAAAKNFYLNAREIYINLEYNEKKDIYKNILELYKRLSKKLSN